MAGKARGNALRTLGFKGTLSGLRDFPVAQMVKNLPTMQETWVQSLGQEDPLEKEMAIPSIIFTWRIPQEIQPTRGAGGLQSMGSQRVRDD